MESVDENGGKASPFKSQRSTISTHQPPYVTRQPMVAPDSITEVYTLQRPQASRIAGGAFRNRALERKKAAKGKNVFAPVPVPRA